MTLPYSPEFLRMALIGLLALGLIVYLANRRADQRRRDALGGQIPRSLFARFQPTGMAEANVIARLGENAMPATSLDTILLHTTPGVRLISVTMTLVVNYLIWVQGPGILIPSTGLAVAVSASTLIACLGLFLYEARVESDRLIVKKWGLSRREYLWRDLSGIKDNGHYEYTLTFNGKKVRMPKHLVGIHGFLTFVGHTLTGNQTRDARTARS